MRRIGFALLIAIAAIAWTFFYPAERFRVWLAERGAR
jgi:hypothetical protein